MNPIRWLLPVLLLPAPVPRAAEKWTTFENCTVDRKDYRDGDSLHVRNAKGREYIFRLYFVDSPETDKQYPDRLEEQGAYFMGIDKERVDRLRRQGAGVDTIGDDEVIRVGKEAARFTDDFLRGSFTVHTLYHNARGNSTKPRYYAIIEKDGVSLAEALVERGLARIHGVEVTPPGASTEKAYLLRLQGKENEAQRTGVGGWAKLAGARGKNAAGASPAAWQVEEQDATTRSITILQSPAPPHAVIGNLPAGRAVRVLGSSAFPTKVRIRFAKPDGSESEALCERSAVGL